VTWIDILAGAITGGVGAIIMWLLSRSAKTLPRMEPPEPPEPPQTTSAEDAETTFQETDDAIISATADTPDADVDVVSDLVGLADSER